MEDLQNVTLAELVLIFIHFKVTIHRQGDFSAVILSDI